jgi:beta-glucosidase-like glycosyl hydrolase
MNRLQDYKNATTVLSKKEKIGQLFMPAAFINDTEEEIQALESLIVENHVGGLCFFHSRASAATNYEGKKEVIRNGQSFKTLQNLVKRYQQKSKHRLLMAIDAEWGLAMRIENTPQYPYAITLGALQDKTDLIFQVGKNIAYDCKQAGVHYNLAPVSDINNNPNNPVIGYRSFGEDKINVTEKSLAYIKGMQSEGVICSIKHFPGHGDTAVDSHLGLPIIEKSKEELLSNELFPFKELIKENVDSIMVGHLSVPSLTNGQSISSSISKDIIDGLLRNELGFKGVVISDALNMHAVSKIYPVKGELEWLAFDAGNDILCFAEHISEGIDKIQSNATENQIEEVFKRVWELKEKAIKAEVESQKELSNPDLLNEEIAKNCITFCNGNKSEIIALREEGFLSISNIQNTDNLFITELKEHFNFKRISISEESIKSIKRDINSEENILLSLFPPQVKPTDNFGFTKTEIQFINELISSKNVVLYLFGNPYALRVFNYENASAVILVYQEFKEFQKVAAAHFMGSVIAKGKLPVIL